MNLEDYSNHDEEKANAKTNVCVTFSSSICSMLDVVNEAIHHYVIAHPPSAALEGIQSGLNAKLISLSKDAGTCVEVFSRISMNSALSTDGLWEGRLGFNYFGAPYKFQFENLHGSNYEKYINLVVDDVIIPTGIAATSQPLFLNLLYWCTFTHKYYSPTGHQDEESLTRFQFSGDLKVILDQQFTIFYLMRYTYSNNSRLRPDDAKERVDCTSKSVRYNKFSGELEISWGDGHFPFYGDGSVGNPFSNCAKVMPTGNPSYMGWMFDLQGYTYTFVIDQVSLLLAVSVNLGVLDSSSLQDAGIPVSEPFFLITDAQSNNIGLLLTSKFDPRFPGHKPLFCTTKPDGKTFCFIEIAGRLCIPNFSPFDSKFNDCNDRGQPAYENVVDMIVSCTFFPPDFYTDDINGDDFGDNDELVASILALNSSVINTLGQKMWHDPAAFDEICHGCFVVWNNIYTPSGPLILNEHFYILKQGHCNDTFKPNPLIKHQLLLSPPRPIQENYFECTDTLFGIVSNSYGIASSNAISIGTIVIGIAVYIYLIFHKFDHPESHQIQADVIRSAVGGSPRRKFSVGLLGFNRLKNEVSPATITAIRERGIDVNKISQVLPQCKE